MKIGFWCLAFLVSATPLAAQSVLSDTTRRGGFQGPGSSEATITEDSQPKDPFVRIPLNFFDPWQEAKARVEESIGLRLTWADEVTVT